MITVSKPPTKSRQVVVVLGVTFALFAAWLGGRFLHISTKTSDRPIAIAQGIPVPLERTPPKPAQAPPSPVAAGDADAGILVENEEGTEEPEFGQPIFYPRDPREWQGRLVDLSMQAICGDTGFCGRAMACLPAGKCGPCRLDRDCLTGERCVLDHCLKSAQVRCTRRANCKRPANKLDRNKDYCLIRNDGKSDDDARGNSSLWAVCSWSDEGRHTVEPAAGLPKQEGMQFEENPLDPDELLEELRRSKP